MVQWKSFLQETTHWGCGTMYSSDAVIWDLFCIPISLLVFPRVKNVVVLFTDIQIVCINTHTKIHFFLFKQEETNKNIGVCWYFESTHAVEKVREGLSSEMTYLCQTYQGKFPGGIGQSTALEVQGLRKKQQFLYNLILGLASLTLFCIKVIFQAYFH